MLRKSAVVWIYLPLCLLFHVPLLAEERKIISKNGKFGVVDEAGKEIIAAKHGSIVRVKDYFIVSDSSAANDIAYELDKVNASVLDAFPDWPCISLPPGGAGCHRPTHSSAVRKKSTATFYDLNGNRIGKSKYVGQSRRSFRADWILYLKADGEAVFADEKGNEVLLTGAQTVDEMFTEEILIVEKWSGKPNLRRYGLLSFDGKIRTPIKYHSIEKSSEKTALFLVRVWGDKEPNTMLHGFINSRGEEIVRPQYTYASEFRDGMAKIYKGAFRQGPPTYINAEGKELILSGFITKEFEGDAEFSDGLLAVSVPEGWGYVDRQGALVIAPQFEEAGRFRDKLAIVKKKGVAGKDGKYGAVNSSGKFVIPPIYDRMLEFVSGAAIVYNFPAKQFGPYSYGLVDRSGKILSPLIYSDLSRKDNLGNELAKHIIGTISVGQAKKQCLLDDRGRLLIPCKYDFIHTTSKGGFEATLAKNELESTYYYFDNNGKFLRKDKP